MLFKTCTKCKIEKSTDQFYKQKSGKYGVLATCKMCGAAYKEQNKEHIAAYRKIRYEANKHEEIVRQKSYYQKNKETIKLQKKHYSLENPEARPIAMKKWQQKNLGKVYANNAKYRASVREATPSWADKEAIAGMYQLAAIFNSTGINLHVDHIVPLKSNKVCGLHSEDNLRLLPATENITKGNRYWDDMWTTT